MNDEGRARQDFRNFLKHAVCFKHVITRCLIGPELPKFGRIPFGSLEPRLASSSVHTVRNEEKEHLQAADHWELAPSLRGPRLA
ncbi:hypothetical protein [Rhizobium sp. P28RR-XV]|uniref:hypothetical protein n=1 Tax=Rhizobium sp. P28RR-XV TaxID=2726737 RepID=UPI00145794CF|nr:hypothetical protein [Rhizobium sp. P28RR-XV]NLR85501.1 hypothetical protein [Rhizobium sp. P28RR-XV]